jgi:hypothetical protein
VDFVDVGDGELIPPDDLSEQITDAELFAIMKNAAAKSRGYANYWTWPLDPQLAELDVASKLSRYIAKQQPAMNGNVKALPVGQDPPDTVLTTANANSVGIEVTELVHPAAIKEYLKAKRESDEPCYVHTNWTPLLIAEAISERIKSKDIKLNGIKPNYHKMILAICTDEPMIYETAAVEAIELIDVECSNIDECYLLLSYHPNADEGLYPDKCPVFAINVRLTPQP